MTTTTGFPTSMSQREAQLIMRGMQLIQTGELRRVRDTLRLSRPRMAALLGVNEFTLRSWELDKRIPDTPRLIKLAKVVDNLSKAIDDTS